MDRRFKERLIGAVVLAVVAVLILPAVLNGPHAPLPEPAGPGETAMRTETIELKPASRFAEPAPASSPRASAQAPAAKAPDAQPPAPAAPLTPTPDAAERTSSADPMKEGASAPATTTAAPPAPEAAPPTPAPEEAPRVASAAKPSASPAKAAAPTAASGAGWAVQVGTFANASNATALAADLKARGYAAFVAPVASGDKTLYRVRIGPMPDVESARALEQRLEKEMPAADVVRQP